MKEVVTGLQEGSTSVEDITGEQGLSCERMIWSVENCRDDQV